MLGVVVAEGNVLKFRSGWTSVDKRIIVLITSGN